MPQPLSLFLLSLGSLIRMTGIARKTKVTKEQNEVTLANDRNKATHRMWQKAERLGATHVIGLKFQNHTMSPFEAAVSSNIF
jgi:uncharacterized protein YbjQ (UPF0145 family)